MPRVPASTGPQLRDAATPTVYQNTPDVAAGGRALAEGLGAAAQVANRVVMRDAETAANTADNEVTAAWNQWDMQARQAYRGAKVGDYQADAEKWWKDAGTKYAGALDPLAKRMVSEQLTRRRTVALGAVGQFVSVEKERLADDAAQANINTTIQFGVTSGDVAGARAGVRKTIAQVAARKGWTTEQVQAEIGKNLSMLHLAQITKLASVDAAAATSYYEANRGEVEFDKQAKVEEILKGERDNQFADRFAAQVATKPYEQQLADAGKISDQQQRERTLMALRTQHAALREARIETEQRFSDTAWQLVGQGKRVPAAVLAGMDGRERVQLQDHLAQKAKMAAAGTPVRTDWNLYIDLREKLAAGEKVDLRPYAGTRLAGAQLEQLLDIQTKTPKAPAAQREVATLQQQMNATMKDLKIVQSDRQGRFMSFVQDAVDDAAKAGGKPLTYDQRQAIIDQAVLQGPDPDAWLWGQKRMFELTPDQRTRFKPNAATDAPATEIEALNEALKAQGIAQTAANRLALYTRARAKAQ